MIEIQSRWRGVTDREKWATRGASFVANAKATKVWFPPKPVETGKEAASTAKKVTKEWTGAAERTTNGTKGVSGPLRRKRT